MALTKQEYYDLLVTTSRNGGFPAVRVDDYCFNNCVYRGGDGRKCAVGLIMPDDRYKKELEGTTASHVCKVCGTDWVPKGITAEDLENIQSAHDNLSNGDWRHIDFVTELDQLVCFADVQKENHAIPVNA